MVVIRVEFLLPSIETFLVNLPLLVEAGLWQISGPAF